jgi:ribosome-associated translation inhibitor RaiA
MQTPIRVTFQGLPPSDALEAAIRDEAAALERYFDRITSCHVTMSEPHRHQHKGRLYRVRIHLAVPGDELVVDREHRNPSPNQELYSELAHMTCEEFQEMQVAHVSTDAPAPETHC